MTGQILFGIKLSKNWKESLATQKDPTYVALSKGIWQAKTKEEAIAIQKEADDYWEEKKAKEA